MSVLRFINLCTIICLLVSCKNDQDSQTDNQLNDLTPKTEVDSATAIINSAYKASGVAKLEYATIDFNFRDKNYRATREGGSFQLERMFTDSIGAIRDVLNNDEFRREVDNVVIRLADSMANRYSESVNSVHYFSVLPLGLKDKAVHKNLLGSETINDKNYHKLKITFNEDGGGQDFEDEFIYWIDKDSNVIDFLAYSFTVNGGGLRFREAYNPRIINGVRIVDYNNYKPSESSGIKLEELGKHFENGSLKLLSTIELNDVKISQPSSFR